MATSSTSSVVFRSSIHERQTFEVARVGDDDSASLLQIIERGRHDGWGERNVEDV